MDSKLATAVPVALLCAAGVLSPCAAAQAQKGLGGVSHQQRRDVGRSSPSECQWPRHVHPHLATAREETARLPCRVATPFPGPKTWEVWHECKMANHRSRLGGVRDGSEEMDAVARGS